MERSRRDPALRCVSADSSHTVIVQCQRCFAKFSDGDYTPCRRCAGHYGITKITAAYFNRDPEHRRGFEPSAVIIDEWLD